MSNDTQLSQTQEFQRLEQSGKMMVEKISELIVVVQDKLFPADKAVKILDVFIENITAEYNRQGDMVKAMMKQYMDFCNQARTIILQVKNRQN